MPKKYRAIFRAGYNVAVTCVVALTPGEAGDHPIVAKDDLGDLGGLGGEDAERVVPEPGSNHKPAVDSGNEAVRLHPNLLREVVPEMPPGLLARAVRHDGQDGVHRERKVHRAWPLLRIGRGLCWCCSGGT